MANICYNCNSEIKDINSKFCTNCGAQIERIKAVEEEKKEEPKGNDTKTLLNMNPNTEAIILYFVPIIGLVAMLMQDKKYNEFSLFHYKQSATLFIVLCAINLIGGLLKILVVPILMAGIADVLLLIFAIGAAIRANQGEKFPIPVIKDLSLKFWN